MVRTTKTNAILSSSSAYKGETIPPVNPNFLRMSFVPHGYKIVSKITSLPELFYLQFVESQPPNDIREIIDQQDPQLKDTGYARNRYNT